MPDHALTTLFGEVTDIFAHPFIVRTEKGKILADLGPKGVEQVILREGYKVTLSGEMETVRTEGPHDSEIERPEDRSRT